MKVLSSVILLGIISFIITLKPMKYAFFQNSVSKELFSLGYVDVKLETVDNSCGKEYELKWSGRTTKNEYHYGTVCSDEFNNYEIKTN